MGGLFRKVREGDDFQVGYHDPDGIFIASGPQIKQKKNLECSIFDVAPTILHFLGLPVDKDMDGRIVNEIFIEELQNRIPQYKSAEEYTIIPEAEGDNVYSEQDKEKLQQRLKDLGYM